MDPHTKSSTLILPAFHSLVLWEAQAQQPSHTVLADDPAGSLYSKMKEKWLLLSDGEGEGDDDFFTSYVDCDQGFDAMMGLLRGINYAYGFEKPRVVVFDMLRTKSLSSDHIKDQIYDYPDCYFRVGPPANRAGLLLPCGFMCGAPLLGGITCCILEWADIINAHIISGQEIVKSIASITQKKVDGYVFEDVSNGMMLTKESNVCLADADPLVDDADKALMRSKSREGFSDSVHANKNLEELSSSSNTFTIKDNDGTISTNPTTNGAKEITPHLGYKVFFALILILGLSAFIHTAEASACKRRRHPPAHKPQMVLVHGFSSAGSIWFQTRYILEIAGYNVTTIDLKACGLDMTDISTVHTFEDYNEPLDRFMSQLPEEEKVVVVGLSAGGVSVTKILHDHPRKVLVAVYLSATMLKNGYVSCRDLDMGLPNFANSSCRASCPTVPSPTCFQKTSLGWAEIPLKDQTALYTLGKSTGRPGPLRAIIASNFTEEAQRSSRIDRVPRVYIKTLLDGVLTPAQQSAMIEAWPPCEVVEIYNGHDTPFSMPQVLFGLIVNATMYSPRN